MTKVMERWPRSRVMEVALAARSALRRPASPLEARGNGSPVIQPGYRRGQKPPNAGKRYPAELLTETELAALLSATPKSGPTGMRNRALYVTLYRVALRINEALALYPKDIDADRGALTVLQGKGRKRRTVAIDAFTCQMIDRWLTWRAQHRDIGRAHPIFCTIARGYELRAINAAYVRRNLKQLAAKAGIEKRVHPHGMRHSWAVNALDAGVDLRAIQKQLGHSSLAITAHYLDHLAPGRVLEAVLALAVPAELRDLDLLTGHRVGAEQTEGDR